MPLDKITHYFPASSVTAGPHAFDWQISYPRPQAQGWMGERDMHQGQAFARLLNIDIG